jgi:ribosomal protein S18 acetylase RimI-like enzyme
MPIHIRPYTPADQAFITALVARFSEFDLPAWRPRQEIDNANQAALLKAMLTPEADAAIFIAANENDTPAGFMHLQTQFDYFNGEKHGYISDLAVDPAFEGQGVGQLLMDCAEAWTREKGYSLLTLYVFAGNTRARRLYEKNGFGQEVIKYVKPIG